MSTTRTPPRRTLWEEGRRPGRLVINVAVLAAAAVVVLDLALTERIGWLFDVGFVMLCVAAALAVRPRDFFGVGVLPPLLMAAVVVVLAVVERSAVADPRDGAVQAVVSGLAHHAGALVTGYVLTLAVLALRQVALRNSGALRARHRSGSTAARGPRPAARTSTGARDTAVRVDAPADRAWIPEQPAPAERPHHRSASR